ncbi:Retrovirus-related Pol polyprotein from transposon RE2 [Vitis vinifera]|uniref:Retrovirus-related Pol polyprotein from transposon RE2 n=1 Tax=Vitis vinifera TaxID=29760 RepID=A0A438JBF3_VITVI|nr:Retrovirus-related Pol polyprotein from transposon RE2 [Vitis vinifera]
MFRILFTQFFIIPSRLVGMKTCVLILAVLSSGSRVEIEGQSLQGVGCKRHVAKDTAWHGVVRERILRGGKNHGGGALRSRAIFALEELLGFLLSLSTWYQSQGRKPNSFQFPRVINSGKPSGDRVSFWSPSPSPKTFRSAWRRSPTFPKAPEPENSPRAGHVHFYGRRLNLKRRRVRAREAFSGDALPPPTLPDADHPPYIPGSPIRALHVPLLGIFVSVGPPNSLSGEAPATFSPPQSLHVPWEVFFYLPGGTTPRSEAVSLFRENFLSWSASVELWFMDQGYEDHLVTQEADIPEAKGLYTNDIQRLYKVASAIVHISQQDLDLSTYIGQIVSLKEEFLTVMPLTPDVGAQQIQLDKFFMVLTLISLRLDLEPIHDQILGSSSVPSLDDVFARLLLVPKVEVNVLIAPIAINLATLAIVAIGYMDGLLALPIWPSPLILRCLSLRAPPHLRHLRLLLPLLPSLDLFSSITTTSALPTVILANGSQTVAKGIGLAIPLPSLPLTSVLYIPECPFNLISINKITRALNCSITFSDKFVTLQDRSTRKTIGIGRESQGLYHLTSDSSPAVCISTDVPLLIHNRLGHPSLSKFQKMVPRFSTLSSLPCESCQLGKHTLISFPKRLNNRAKSPFELVHTNVWGPCRTASTLGFQYFVTFIDDYSRSPFTSFMSHHGILHQSSCAHTPQQNGVVERKNRHLVETARTIFLHRQAFCKAMKCLFLGYSRLQKGYRCYSLETHRYFISADVTFFEDSPFFSTTSESLPVSEVYHRRPRVAAPLPFVEAPADSLPIPSASPAPALPSPNDLPIAIRKVGCRWVYAVKVGPDGQVDRLKARLVAKGYTQVYGSDYGDTFSPVAKIASVRLLLSMAAMWGVWFSVHVTPFSIWLETISSSMCIYLVVYVDNIVITGSDQDGIQKLKQHLFTHFQTKDLGKLKYFLGIEIAQSSSGVVLSQRKTGEPLGDPGRYRRLVGKLNYLTISRPDISFPVSVVSQFLQSPCDSHWDAVVGYTDADWAGSPTDRHSTSRDNGRSSHQSTSNGIVDSVGCTGQAVVHPGSIAGADSAATRRLPAIPDHLDQPEDGSNDLDKLRVLIQKFEVVGFNLGDSLCTRKAFRKCGDVLVFSAVSVPVSESIHRRFDTGSSRKLSFYENRGGGRVKTEICSAFIFFHSNKPSIVRGNLKPTKVFWEKGFLSMTACELILGKFVVCSGHQQLVKPCLLFSSWTRVALILRKHIPTPDHMALTNFLQKNYQHSITMAFGRASSAIFLSASSTAALHWFISPELVLCRIQEGEPCASQLC